MPGQRDQKRGIWQVDIFAPSFGARIQSASRALLRWGPCLLSNTAPRPPLVPPSANCLRCTVCPAAARPQFFGRVQPSAVVSSLLPLINIQALYIFHCCQFFELGICTVDCLRENFQNFHSTDFTMAQQYVPLIYHGVGFFQLTYPAIGLC